jgi:uncharacterized protein YaaN involved in tellurite resistance
MSTTSPNFEPIVDVKTLSAQELEKAKGIASSIELMDSQAVIQYGISAQKNISSFSDTILTQIRSKDAGEVGTILTDLMVKVKDLNVEGLGKAGGFLNKLFGGIRKFIAKYEKLSVHIERIISELEKNRMMLLKDITLLDNLFEKNTEYLKELDIYISAGQIKLEEIYATILPEFKKKAEESDDPIDAQKFQDFNQAVNRFEKKLHDLKLSRMISIQTNPQIRLIQGNDQVLVEKIQGSILNTIPLWKSQLVIAISLFRQKSALELQRDVSNTTNDLLKKNSEMLKQGSLDVAKESERGIVDMETLKKVNDDLISTIDETLQIQAEGRLKRKQAETELIQMEDQLKNRLRSIEGK